MTNFDQQVKSEDEFSSDISQDQSSRSSELPDWALANDPLVWAHKPSGEPMRPNNAPATLLKSNNCLEAALEAAAAGQAVFPCRLVWNLVKQHWDKTPATPNGFHDATTDIAQIRKWWTADPTFAIGMVPSSAGLLVVDADEYQPKFDPSILSKLPPTRTHRTVSGGRHMLFRSAGRFGNGRLAAGYDIRSAKGFVVLPPSYGSKPDGSRSAYTVEDAREPVELPGWVAERLRAAEDATSERKRLTWHEGSDDDDTLAYARGMLRATSENTDGWQVACRLRRDCGLTGDAAAELWQEWQQNFVWQWDTNDVERLLTNAARYGKNEPGSGVNGQIGLPGDDRDATTFDAFADVIASQWAEPVDIFGTITPEPVLTRDLVPAVIADFAFDAAERIGIDPAVVACACLATCAAAIDDEIQIQPKVHDHEWQESARLNVLIAAPVGAAKTPGIAAATKPLKTIDAQWQKDDAQKIAQWEDAERKHKADAVFIERQIKAHGRFTAEAKNTPDPLPERPRKRRLIITDTTTEGVCRILRDNPRGLLLEVDEAMGWLASFDVYRNGSTGKDRAFWLSADNGGPYAKDRADEKASFLVPNLSISVLGGIQPEKLRGIAKDLHNDGLIQRSFVILAGAGNDGVDRAPIRAAVDAYAALVARLIELRPSIPAKAITLSNAAQAARKRVTDLARAFRDWPTTPAPFKEHLAKWQGRFARLLLLFHLVEDGGTEVEREAADRAADFMIRFLLPMQTRFYHEYFSAADPTQDDARWIAGHILARGKDQVTLREIKRARHIEEPQIGAAMTLLQQAKWVGEEQEDEAKRSIFWAVNGRVHQLFSDRAAAERARRAETKRKIEEAAAIRRAAGYSE